MDLELIDENTTLKELYVSDKSLEYWNKCLKYIFLKPHNDSLDMIDVLKTKISIHDINDELNQIVNLILDKIESINFP